MSEYRKICAWCKTDLGPIGPEFNGNTHGICPDCQAAQLALIDSPTPKKDVKFMQRGVVVENRNQVTYYHFTAITDASKLRLWKLAVAIRPPAKKRRKRGNSWGGRRGQRNVSAASVLAAQTERALAELVSATNEVNDARDYDQSL